jgi:predicted O-methyltransferase YrrM
MELALRAQRLELPPVINLPLIADLYRGYARDLKETRIRLDSVYRQKVHWRRFKSAICRWSDGDLDFGGIGMSHFLKRLRLIPAVFSPGLDDIEAEITYLLVRACRPVSVVEISPSGGWSSLWILSALRDNGVGALHSYDLVDDATKNVPDELGRGRWHFELGDVTRKLEALPERIDYLFMDSDHSAPFARWYLDALVPRLDDGALMSVHDVFHTADPARPYHGPLGPLTGLPTGRNEATVVVDWLEREGVPYFTASAARAARTLAQIRALRARLGIDGEVHYHPVRASMIWFHNRRSR